MNADRPISVQIAAEIRKLLFLRDMTATQLAEQAGMTQPYISRRLTGATKFDVDDLTQIAAALGVEITALLPVPTGDIKIRSGRVSGRPRSTAKLHARHSTTRPTPTPADWPKTPVAAAATSGPRARPSWRDS